jgi:branched-chain amino acid transport system ATP-binding protein
LTRRFGGLAAVNDVAIGIEHGRLHAVLGPNGAGKTTLINLLSGDLDASSGSVIYKGEDITHHSADRRSRMGIGRSYQKTNIFRRSPLSKTAAWPRSRARRVRCTCWRTPPSFAR